MKLFALIFLLVSTANAHPFEGACRQHSRELSRATEISETIREAQQTLVDFALVRTALASLESAYKSDPSKFPSVETKDLYSIENYVGSIRQPQVLQFLNAIVKFESLKSDRHYAAYYPGFLALVRFLRSPSSETLASIQSVGDSFEEDLNDLGSISSPFPKFDALANCLLEQQIASVTRKNVSDYIAPAPWLALPILNLSSELWAFVSSSSDIRLAAMRVSSTSVFPAEAWQDALETSDVRKTVEQLYLLGSAGTSALERFEYQLAELLGPVADGLDAENLHFPRRSLARKLLLVLDAQNMSDLLNLRLEFEKMSIALNGGSKPLKEKKLFNPVVFQ